MYHSPQSVLDPVIAFVGTGAAVVALPGMDEFVEVVLRKPPGGLMDCVSSLFVVPTICQVHAPNTELIPDKSTSVLA